MITLDFNLWFQQFTNVFWEDQTLKPLFSWKQRLVSLLKKKAAFVLSDHSLSFCNLLKSPFSYMEYNIKNTSGDLCSEMLLFLLYFLKLFLKKLGTILLQILFFFFFLSNVSSSFSLFCKLRDIMIKNSHHAHLPVRPVLCHLAVEYQSSIINVLWKLSRLDM